MRENLSNYEMKMNNSIDERHFASVDLVEGVTADYKNARVHVRIAPKMLTTYNGQAMTIVACNLLSRWVEGLAVNIPDEVECVIKKYGGRKLRSVVSEIISAGRTDCIYCDDNSLTCLFELSIGPSTQPNCIWIDCDGWLAGYGCNTTNLQTEAVSQSIIGASFAACLGVSEIFRQAVGKDRVQFKKWFSLFDYNSDAERFLLMNPTVPESLRLGTVHQVGCGAIGSSFDFLLSLIDNVEADLFLIDHDHIEGKNRAASLVFTPVDAAVGNKKVDACAREVSSLIKVEPYPNDYASFITRGSYREHVPDIILCFANERNIWSTIQHKCPPLTFHATTTKNWGTNFGRHTPHKDWCIMCRFGKEVKPQVSTTCSQGNISSDPGKEQLGVLPFVAPASAIIVLSSLFKIENPEYMNTPAFVQFSMRSVDGHFIHQPRESKGCEICSCQDIDIYPQYIKQTKHWYLSV